MKALPRGGHRVLASSRRLYVDDELVISGQAATPPVLYDSHPFYIGAETNPGLNCYLVGDVDEVRIWNRALSVAEIAADRHECSTPTSAGLVSSWSFDEGTGQTANDSTSANPLQLGSIAISDGADPTWVSSTVPF